MKSSNYRIPENVDMNDEYLKNLIILVITKLTSA